MDDSTFLEATRSYKVVRIQLENPRTGSGGTGELAWVWQVATFCYCRWRFSDGGESKACFVFRVSCFVFRVSCFVFVFVFCEIF